MTGMRNISMQEAVHKMHKIDLRLCSEYMVKGNLFRGLQLHGGKRKKSQSGYKFKDSLCCHRNCTDDYHFVLLLEEWFYEVLRKKKLYEDEEIER